SRRRHTRSYGDWSSDVCSSDLGFDAFVASDVPVGSGLSSSGALDVASAVAVLAARGIEMPALETARLCQAAENGFVGAHTGIMRSEERRVGKECRPRW